MRIHLRLQLCHPPVSKTMLGFMYNLVAYPLNDIHLAREKWLGSTFPRFSAKSRGGRPPATQPPPHTIRAHGRYDLSIGPHIFPNTAIYEVHYIPQGPQQVQPAAGPPPPSQPQEAVVTPTLISQVNAAAESNPILSRLLHTAAAGRATPEEINTLGILIRSLGISAEPAPPPPVAVPSAPVAPPQPVKEFDIVIEFQERTTDRWVFPRGITTIEPSLPEPNALHKRDLLMNVALPFPPNISTTEKGSQDEPTPVHEPTRVVTFRWVGVPPSVHEMVVRWIGGEAKITENMHNLENIVK